MVSDDKSNSKDNQRNGMGNTTSQDNAGSESTPASSKNVIGESKPQIGQRGRDKEMGIPNEQAQDLGMRTDLSELEDNIHSYLPPSPPQDFGMQAFAPIIRDDDLNIQQVQSRIEIAKPPPEAMRGAPELIRESKEESHIQGNIDPISNDQAVGAAGFLHAIVAFVKRILYLLRD